MARAADLDPAVKFLAKVAKGTKGMVDVDVATEALARMPGWSMTPVVFPYEAWQLYTGDLREFIKANLGPIEAPDRELNRARTKELKTMATLESQIGEVLRAQGHIGLPDQVEEGGVYIENFDGPKIIDVQYREGRTGYSLGQMWLGVAGWRVTAPDGASDYVHGPFHGNYRDTPAGFAKGPVFENLVGFWTFLYKHGAKADAKAALDAAGSDVLEQANMTKAQRDRVAAQRMFLPEIQKLWNDLTQSRFESVVKYLTLVYIHNANDFIEKQFEPYSKRPTMTGQIIDMVEKHKVRWSEEWSGKHEEYNKLNDTYYMKADYKAIAERHARLDAEEARRQFVFKNTERISNLARRKGQKFDVIVIDENDEGVAGYGGNVIFTFEDGSSFVLRNKTIWKYAPVSGRLFAQYPTTFHDVKMPGGKKMPTPHSEERMLSIFAPQSEPNPHHRRVAERLSRGDV